LAAYEEVAQRGVRKKRSAQLDKAKRQAVERLQLCQDELNRLHGDELNSFLK